MTSEEFERLAAPHIEHEVAANRLPRLVGKYRSMEQVSTFLKNPKMWFATFSEFNDPFEGKFHLHADAHTSPTEITAIKNHITKHLNSYGVLCLTHNLDNILMWGHYADKHRGAILVFDITEDPRFFAAPIKVTYSFNYPTFTPRNYKEALKAMAMKFMMWQHENEIRVLKPNCHGLHPVNKKALKKIIFGCKADAASIARVTEELNTLAGYDHVQLQRAVMDKHAYRLEYVEISR